MIFRNLTTKLQKCRKISFFYIFIFRFIIVVFLTIHFSILFLYQLPDNPIKQQYSKNLGCYVDPFFTQAWTLFAPNPINSNMSLLFRFQIFDSEIRDTTEWVDISEPMILMHRKSFFSSAQRINKFTQSCMSDVDYFNTRFYEYIAQIDSLKVDSIKAKQYYLNNIGSSEGHKAILKYASYVANNHLENKKYDSIFVQYKIFNAKFPRFSKRKEDYYNLKLYEFTEFQSDFFKLSE